MNAGAVSLRPIEPGDDDVLCAIYGSTREEELAPLGWSDEQKRAFVTMQFRAQAAYYRQNYPGATFDLIVAGGQPVGRLYVYRDAREIRIVDIALLPAHRGGGIGSRLIAALMDEARGRKVPLHIHVEIFNRAMGLYLRLGFRKIADRGVYHFLEWSPDGVAPSPAPAT